MHKHTFVLAQNCVHAVPCYDIKEKGCIRWKKVVCTKGKSCLNTTTDAVKA